MRSGQAVGGRPAEYVRLPARTVMRHSGPAPPTWRWLSALQSARPRRERHHLPKWVPTRMREVHHSPPARDHRARSLGENADLCVSPCRRRQSVRHPRHLLRSHGETDLVVLASTERQLACAHVAGCSDELRRDGKLLPRERDTTATCFSELACIAKQTVRDIDTRTRVVAESQTKFNARCREVESLTEIVCCLRRRSEFLPSSSASPPAESPGEPETKTTSPGFPPARSIAGGRGA